MSDLNLFNHDESPFDAGRIPCPQGGEDFWSARWLQREMGYESWQKFEGVIERAKVAAHNQGFNVKILFTITREKSGGVITGSDKNPGGRPSTDYRVTRFAAYLIAMNGDPRKPEVAAAQAYFAIRTREAEVTPPAPALTGPALMAAALVEAQATLEARDSQIAVMTPKADYVDHYVTDNDLMKLRTVAAVASVGETWLRDKLLEKDWIYFEEDSRWSHSKQRKEFRKRYSAKSDKRAYFRPVEEHKAPRFKGETMHTLKVTPRGATAIANIVPRWISEELK